jgi:probable addiction module antidote protein
MCCCAVVTRAASSATLKPHCPLRARFEGETIMQAVKKIETRPWDVAQYLRDEESIRAYIEAAQEEAPDDAAFMAAVLGDVARSRNMSELARQTGISRETLYKATRGDGNPTLDTVSKLARALGFRLTLQPLPAR